MSFFLFFINARCYAFLKLSNPISVTGICCRLKVMCRGSRDLPALLKHPFSNAMCNTVPLRQSNSTVVKENN